MGGGCSREAPPSGHPFTRAPGAGRGPGGEAGGKLGSPARAPLPERAFGGLLRPRCPLPPPGNPRRPQGRPRPLRAVSYLLLAGLARLGAPPAAAAASDTRRPHAPSNMAAPPGEGAREGGGASEERGGRGALPPDRRAHVRACAQPEEPPRRRPGCPGDSESARAPSPGTQEGCSAWGMRCTRGSRNAGTRLSILQGWPCLNDPRTLSEGNL